MIEWKQSMILYHGSYCSVNRPDLSKCGAMKDFGQGFYLTTSLEQARNFVHSAVKKAEVLSLVPRGTTQGVVTEYRFSLSDGLKIKEYPDADAEWLHCIAAHRKGNVFAELKQELAPYDIIAGKIANDQTNATLTAYLAQLFGQIGTYEADEICIRRLLPERLENQICLRTQRALEVLEYIGEETVWTGKR